MQKLLILFFVVMASFSAVAGADKQIDTDTQATIDTLIDNFNRTQSEAKFFQPLKNDGHKYANMRCGLKPLPPLGCKVGACVCDQSGRNCRWTFVCD